MGFYAQSGENVKGLSVKEDRWLRVTCGSERVEGNMLIISTVDGKESHFQMRMFRWSVYFRLI